MFTSEHRHQLFATICGKLITFYLLYCFLFIYFNQLQVVIVYKNELTCVSYKNPQEKKYQINLTRVVITDVNAKPAINLLYF